MRPLIEARDLSVVLGTRPVLHGISLRLGPGEVVGLIGPNGAGKTTLIRALTGRLPANAGTVCYDGRPIGDWQRRARARMVAYLPQEREAAWPITVRELVALGRLPGLGFGRKETAADRDAVAAALADCDLGPLAERPIDRLSTGERARALLARAYAVGAGALLVDEPAAGLDPLHQLQVMRTLHDKARNGIGIIAVLHDLGLASRFCDRLLVLDGGRIVAEGAYGAGVDRAALEQVYGVRLFEGRIDGQPFLAPVSELVEAPGPVTKGNALL